jgi:hypothetical protein
MYGGADTLLDSLSNGNKEVELAISLTKEKNFDKLTKFTETPYAGGAIYYAGFKTICLGEIFKFIFDGYLPKKIYYKVI